MKTLGWLRKELVTWVEDYESVSEQNTAINRAINLLASEGTFDQLYKEVVVTPSSTGEFYLPPRCMDVLGVYPQKTNGVSSFQFQGAMMTPLGTRRDVNYVRCIGMRETSQYSGIMATFSQGYNSADITSGYVGPELIGEEMRIIGGNEVYSLWNASDTIINFWPEFRWGSGSKEIEIAPQGTPLYKLFYANGEPYTADVSIEYRQKHPYLVRDEDMLLLPIENSVVLEAVRLMLMAGKYDVDAARLKMDVAEIKAVEFPKNQIKCDLNAMPNDDLFRKKYRRR
jgi:hypothetical protein